MNSLNDIPPEERLKIRKATQLDPVYFVEQILGLSLWDKQAEVLRALWKYNRIAVRSGHGVGKSFTAANAVLTFLCAFQPSIIITTAPTWRQVESILWAEINKLNKKSSFNLGGTASFTQYKIAEDWYAIGLSTNEADRFQGFHSPNILVIFDEAPGVAQNINEACEGLLTSQNAKWLKIGNPTSPAGHFYDNFKSQSWHRMHISCLESPNVTIYGQFGNNEADILKLKDIVAREPKEVPYPSLVTAEWILERYHDWGFANPLFQSRVLGDFPNEGNDTLISLSMTETALQPLEWNMEYPRTVIGVDVARYGADRTVFTILQGSNIKSRIVDIEWSHGKSLMETVGMIIRLAESYHAEAVIVDDVGLGGGVTDKLLEDRAILRFQVMPVNVGIPADDAEQFSNLKAEIFWNLREAFRKKEIQIIDKGSLLAELPTLKYKYTSRGQLALVSKEEMRKHGLKSPDFADSLALAHYGLKLHTQSHFTSKDDPINRSGVFGNVRNRVF